VIGSPLYIANSFRPDIAYAVSILSQFTSNPSEEHFREIKSILRYLNGTRSYGLLFTRDNSKKNTLYGYTDADPASCFSRRSRSGFIFYSGNSPLAWTSKKQQTIALSTCESEYYALAEGGKEAIHLNRLLWEFSNQRPFDEHAKLDPVTLYCDNQSTIFVSKNPAEHKMMKHVDLRHKWIQEKVEDGAFQVQYISTKDQVADIFTKPLSTQLFEKFRKLCARPEVPIAGEC
jgi:hypothetical protein